MNMVIHPLMMIMMSIIIIIILVVIFYGVSIIIHYECYGILVGILACSRRSSTALSTMEMKMETTTTMTMDIFRRSEPEGRSVAMILLEASADVQ